MKMNIATIPSCWLLMAAAVGITASSGCTSVIGSAYLREAWLDAVEHAAEPTPRPKHDKKTTADDRGDSRPSSSDAEAVSDDDETSFGSVVSKAEASASAAWSPATLDEAVDEADRRLARSGGLNEAARGMLIAMLEDTPRQDWPVVVGEFTAALASSHVDAEVDARIDAPIELDGGTGRASPPTADTSSHRPPVGADRPAAAPHAGAAAAVVEPVAPSPPTDTARDAASQPAQVLSQPEPTRIEPAPPVFAVRNACFASRVRAWGVVDRFETAEFTPGQEVIVYFELDQLSSRESADGHSTRIDTTLRLVDADGRRIHEWTFEPLEETCSSRRHDYFARYLVSLPASAPAGSLRLEIAVSDTLAGRTAHATLPLDMTQR